MSIKTRLSKLETLNDVGRVRYAVMLRELKEGGQRIQLSAADLIATSQNPELIRLAKAALKAKECMREH
jgi:hypothetical protein